jgi:rod shape-determining protein MreC
MARFLEFIVRFKEYAVLSVLIAMSLLLMTFGNTAKLRGFRTVVISSIGFLQEAFAWLPNPLTIVSENAALREANYNLTREVVQTRRAIAENEKLRLLLHFRDSVSPSYNVHPTQIVGRIMDKSRYYLTINAGVSDSIRTGMPVMNDRGLVGFVFSAARHYGIVQTLLDKDTRIAAKIERTRTNGIVAWEGGANVYLTNVSKTEEVKEGDMVVTSDYSSRYPADIPIGRIVEKRDEANTLFWKLRIETAVHFPSLEYIFIGLQQPDPERVMVEELLERRLKQPESQQRTTQRRETPRERELRELREKDKIEKERIEKEKRELREKRDSSDENN